MMLTKLVFVCAHLLIILQCQNIYSDQVPIVYFQQNIWLFKFGDGTYQGSQTIDYSAKSFKQVPVVILGISFYNNYWNPNTGVDFVLSATQITTNSCIVQTSRLNNSILVGISVNALVIDTSQFPFFIKTDKKIQQIVFNNYVNEQTYSFSSSILNQTNKNVSAILTGWTLTYDSSNQVFALTIQVSSITNTGYNIKISTAQNSQKIVNVYFTIIEYVQNPDSSLYGIVSNYDTQYQYPTNKNCFFNSTCSNSDRFFPVQFNVFIQNNSPSNVNYLNFFVSINQIYFNTIQNGQDLRISITNQPLSSNQIQYQYSIWDGSQCLGTTSTALYFYQKLCANSQFVLINNNNNCSTVCQNQDPSDSSVCLDCPTGQYLLLDQKVCQQTQPIGYFCSDPSTQFNFHACQNCKISNCKLCSQINNSFSCTQCISQYFLYNNLCQQQQPSNTYCDTQTYICSKCLDQGCLTCTDPSQVSSSQCLTCDTSQKQILYQGKCYSQSSPPDNTFCDWSKLKCQQCNDINCLYCSDPTNPPQTCNKCVSNQNLYLFQGKCYSKDSPPPNTYCDWSKPFCQLCNDSNCFTCSDPSSSPQICLSCDITQKQILFQGKCYNKNNPPPSAFCDWTQLKCSKCNDSNCLFCSDPSLPPQICYLCDLSAQQLILYQGKCFNQNNPPSNTFCDWSKLSCSQCTDSKCLTCSDPNKLPQICLSCDAGKQQILYQGKCFNQNDPPPPNAYCDWAKLQCTQCTDPSCLTCSDPKQSTQKCLSCDVSKQQVLFQDKCYSQKFPPPNTFCDWDKLQCTPCANKNCNSCSDPSVSPQVCLSCNFRMILFKGQCYCGIGLYQDQNNNCNQKCKQSCQFCQNSSDCDKYSDDRIYSDKQCDYSCSECFIPNKTYGCLACSSTTRQLEVMTGSCFCKSGYSDIGTAECQNDNVLKPQQQIKNANNNILQGLFIIYFPQLFINIHPFTDNLIFSMQSLGNLYFVNQNSTQILYKSFATLNFVNIYYQSQKADSNDVEFMLGIKYKLIIDKLVSQNLIFLSVPLILFSVMGGIVLLFRYKINSIFLENNFLWNVQLKLIRVTSNYFLVNVFLNVSYISQMDLISIILLGILTPIYLGNLLIIFKKSKNIDQNNFLFLHQNLDVNKPFNKYFWLLLEIKKIVLTICLSFIPIKYYLITLLSVSIIYCLALVKYKPFLDCRRDYIYLVINELITIILGLFPLLIILIDDYTQTCNLTNIANIIVIIYEVFQFIITLEYLIRKLISYRNHLSKQKLNNSKPLVVDMSLQINLENLDDILNISKTGNQLIKKQFQFRTKNTTTLSFK